MRLIPVCCLSVYYTGMTATLDVKLHTEYSGRTYPQVFVKKKVIVYLYIFYINLQFSLTSVESLVH
jgi:hypothetical protein